MTINHHHVEHETWTVDEFYVRVNSHSQQLNWSGKYDTYDEAREAGIGQLAAYGPDSGAKMEIIKRTRLATPDEIQAEKDSRVTWADVEAEIAQVKEDIEQVSGISGYQRGQVGDPVFIHLPSYSWCVTHSRIWGDPTTRQPCNLECERRGLYYGQVAR